VCERERERDWADTLLAWRVLSWRVLASGLRTTNLHNLGTSKKSKTPNPLEGRRIPTAFKGIFGAIFPDLPRL